MKAVTWRGKEDVGVDDVDDPRVQRPTDAVVRVTATALCGSDLHLYANLIPGMKPGDILGHEVVGIVTDTGADVRNLYVGDRVVVPFNIACGTCFYCAQGLQSQCERTQNARWHRGGSLFGYTHLYGGVPGGQAEYLRVPFADGGAGEGFRLDRGPSSRPARGRPPDGLAGRRVRGRPRGDDGRGAGARADRTDGRPDRAAPPPSG